MKKGLIIGLIVVAVVVVVALTVNSGKTEPAEEIITEEVVIDSTATVAPDSLATDSAVVTK